ELGCPPSRTTPNCALDVRSPPAGGGWHDVPLADPRPDGRGHARGAAGFCLRAARRLDDAVCRAPHRDRCNPGSCAAHATAATGPRQSGAGHGTAGADLTLQLATGPVIATTHLQLDTRLKYDPDWFGKKDRTIAGRTAEAYVDAQWKFGEVFFGRLDRNWGPPGIAGLLLSANPYGLDHFAVTLGSAKLQFQALATQLDDRDSSNAVVHRFMMQHRLRLVPGRWAVALWEGTVLAGRDRSFEPWYLNALNSGILEQWNNGGNVNSFVGLDFERRARVSAFGQLMLDDIQVDRSGATDQKPVSYALTVGAR